MPAPSLRSVLAAQTATADPALVEDLGDGRVRCLACGHRCNIGLDRRGVCQVRFNEGGELRVPWGYIAGVQLDPIEKKPFFHAHPGENALSFGMLGCDLHCSYCQNWITSQTLRDDDARAPMRRCRPEELASLASEHRSRVVVSTYNEPLITSEWARAIFEPARESGMRCGYVSNGNATPEVLDYLRPFVDLYKVDLKGFDDRRYRDLGGVLANVTRSIEQLKTRGYWVEIVTLLVPGFNDTDEELAAMAAFLAEVDPLMPWHVTAFRPDYKMLDRHRTPAESLRRAHAIGWEAGLRYIYAGNLPGRVDDLESTQCHACGEMLIEREGFQVLRNRLRKGDCPGCGTTIPGVFPDPLD